MNYSFRNQDLWRWCIFTFTTSLLIYVVLAVFKPWGLTVSNMNLWVIPQVIPNCLAWPIANTLFLLTYVWLKTNHLTLKTFWRKRRSTSYLRAILHGLLISLFCQSYSLTFLLVASTILSVVIYFRFGEYFYKITTKKDDECDWVDNEEDDLEDDWFAEDLAPYGIVSLFFFLYTIIVVYGLNKFNFELSFIESSIVFVLAPLIYIALYVISVITIAIAIAVPCLIVVLVYYFSDEIISLLCSIGEEIRTDIKWWSEMFADSGRLWLGIIVDGLAWVFLLCGVFVASIIYVYSLLCYWLFPPRVAT